MSGLYLHTIEQGEVYRVVEVYDDIPSASNFTDTPSSYEDKLRWLGERSEKITQLIVDALGITHTEHQA